MTHDTNTHINDTTPRRLGLGGLATSRWSLRGLATKLTRREAPIRLDRRAGFAAAALALSVGMMGTTLPTPLYVLYRQQFGLSELMITVVFATYAAGIFTGTATATLIDLAAPGRRARATLAATVANMGGLGCGPLLAGVLAQ